MKYLKKIFESEDILSEEVESIFTEFLDEKEYVDGEEYPTCEIKKEETHLVITIFKDQEIDSSTNTLDGFKYIIDLHNNEIKLLNRIKIALERLSHLDYEWGVDISDVEINIKVFYPDGDVTLLDAFQIKGNHQPSVDVVVMRRLLKLKYNIEFSSYSKESGTSGYYGRSPAIYLYLKSPIDSNNQLYKDLSNLERVNNRSVFSRVGLIHNGSTIKLEHY